MRNQATVYDMTVDYEVVYRKIKNPRMEIKTGILVLILPEGFQNHEELIKRYQNWIYDKISLINDSNQYELNLQRSENELKEMVCDLVKKYSLQMRTNPHTIRFRKMKVRWGSCDSKGNLKFNIRLRYLPENLIKYVIFHELAHLHEFGHNKEFWQIISMEYPQYKELDKELSRYWFAIKRHTNDFKDR